MPPAANHCGPIGTPSGATTYFDLAPSLSVPVRLLVSGSVCATWFAHSGAASEIVTSTRNSAPNASATLFRRSRRSASRYGPTAVVPSRSAASANPAVSNANSVAGSMATVRRS